MYLYDEISFKMAHLILLNLIFTYYWQQKLCHGFRIWGILKPKEQKQNYPDFKQNVADDFELTVLCKRQYKRICTGTWWSIQRGVSKGQTEQSKQSIC